MGKPMISSPTKEATYKGKKSLTELLRLIPCPLTNDGTTRIKKVGTNAVKMILEKIRIIFLLVSLRFPHKFLIHI